MSTTPQSFAHSGWSPVFESAPSTCPRRASLSCVQTLSSTLDGRVLGRAPRAANAPKRSRPAHVTTKRRVAQVTKVRPSKRDKQAAKKKKPRDRLEATRNKKKKNDKKAAARVAEIYQKAAEDLAAQDAVLDHLQGGRRGQS